GDARQLVAAHTDAEEDIRAIDVGERRALRQLTGAMEERERVPDLALLLERPRFTGEDPHLERCGARALGGRPRIAERLDRLRVVMRLGQGLRTGDQRLRLRPLLGRDAGGEERRVDAEAL